MLSEKIEAVLGSENAKREFAAHFTRICKLDYGKAFFSALMEYCKGAQDQQSLPDHPPDHLPGDMWERVSNEKVIYAVLAILKRLTSAYSAMLYSESRSGNLIGVELKDLTPKHAPEKTRRIIDLIINSHYPGLTWMMSDVPAWYF